MEVGQLMDYRPHTPPYLDGDGNLRVKRRHSVEHEMCRMIDCVVSDLPPLHKAAIYRCYGISAVFRFPRENYAEILLDAHDILLVLLPKKGVSF